MDYPHKPAPASVEILDAIRQRWSPLAFDSAPIEPEKIAALFEAARWAPSSYNEQPWRYIYALKDDGEDRARLESLLAQDNAWAKDAGMLVISFARSTFARNGRENRHSLHDTGCATGYMFLQLESLGLIGHEMAGFDWMNSNRVLGVPEDFVPGCMMAIGEPGDVSTLSPNLQQRQKTERNRRHVSEFAYWGRWESE
jgi:nitroreductase